MKLILTLFSLLWLVVAQAEEYAAETDKRVTMRTIEPKRDVGYTVGDVLTRTVILEADKPYELLPTSLPVPGTQKKRRNQEQGIELREATVEQQADIKKNIYTVRLTYQVFTNKHVARPAALPPEFIKFGGKSENFQVRVPSWSFRISPLAVYGSVNVEKDMSTFRGPLLLDATQHKQTLWGLLGLLAFSLLGLLYVLGASTWLPRMGGPFAKALRDLKKLPATPEGLSQAVARLHQAFNHSAGGSVFDANGFLKTKPGFATVSADIDRFFGLSRTVFFDPSAAHGIADPMVWLKQFCRRCRDCERGLK